MMVRLKQLLITTRQTTEQLGFSDSVTFLYGPVGTGKSTVARLIDYCFGGELERTPAIQQEFVAVQLAANLGDYHCTLERAATDTQSVRVSWSRHDTDIGSVNAPLAAGDAPVLGEEVFNLSDLLCFLCGITPIKVRKRTRDPDSPMVRLSFRDIWSYC
ncbi:MAG: ATP-binding protein [Bryobacteraceae bacterium]|nr:ATP-binding protein [Bryobacteraceae bacterium]